jgi:hypothetical protein
MTLAICWKCGSRKVGALSACSSCGAFPTVASDQAKSILLSDHYRDADELAQAGQQIASGGTVAFDDGEVERLTQAVAKVPPLPIGCQIAVWVPIVVLLLLVLVIFALFRAGAYSH